MYLEQYQPEYKQCSICKQYLEINNYRRYSHRCNKCVYKVGTSYREQRKYTVDHWIMVALCNSKKRAKLKNFNHNLTKQWLLANIPEYCPVLGIKLSFSGNRDNSPSLDRFDNNKGYTTDNVRIISFRANSLKSNATLAELEAIVRYMKNE